MDNMQVGKNNRRHSFNVFLPSATCEALLETVTLDILYGPDRSQERDVEYHIYPTDDRGNKISIKRDAARDGVVERCAPLLLLLLLLPLLLFFCFALVFAFACWTVR